MTNATTDGAIVVAPVQLFNLINQPADLAAWFGGSTLAVAADNESPVKNS
jgi:hypothetical protein